MTGSLHQTQATKQYGFLSFIRLVGTCYFKRHHSAFESIKGHETPVQLYNSLDTMLPPKEKHELWLKRIRIIGDTILSEEEKVPSITSLWRHWLQSCWVSALWQRSSVENIYISLPSAEESGWLKTNDGYAIDWEAPEVQSKVQHSIDFLTKGCSCKKGAKLPIVGVGKRKGTVGQGACVMGVQTCSQLNVMVTAQVKIHKMKVHQRKLQMIPPVMSSV